MHLVLFHVSYMFDDARCKYGICLIKCNEIIRDVKHIQKCPVFGIMANTGEVTKDVGDYNECFQHWIIDLIFAKCAKTKGTVLRIITIYDSFVIICHSLRD